MGKSPNFEWLSAQVSGSGNRVLDGILQVTMWPRESGPSRLSGSFGLLILVKFQRTIPILVLVVFDAMSL
jgi:hypothetical protein